MSKGLKAICVATRVIFKSMVMLALMKLTPYSSDALRIFICKLENLTGCPVSLVSLVSVGFGKRKNFKRGKNNE